MEPVKFNGYNCIYAENQKEYLPLPSYKTKNGVVVSCWKLSLYEQLQVMFFGKIYIACNTFNKPLQPQRLFSENPLKYYEEK